MHEFDGPPKNWKQPDMFTKRTRKPPPVKERPLHIAIADTLRVGAAPGWFWWHTPNGELRSDATGALLLRMGVKPGVSDFLLLSPEGVLHALEIKREGQKLRVEQIAFLARVAAGGGGTGMADTYEGAVAMLKEWGALSDRLHPQ